VANDQIMLLEDGTEVYLVHFIYLSPAGTAHATGKRLASASDTYKIACLPNLLQLSAHNGRPVPYRRTEDVRGVNCPLCKKTAEFEAATKQLAENLLLR
jgi:hypothetical protein